MVIGDTIKTWVNSQDSNMTPESNILVGDTIYIVGHTTPDLDAVVAAHAYQVYRHSQGDFNYVGVRCDEVNPVTEWAYKRWGADLPPIVANVAGKKIVLVDHTDPEQRPDGWEQAEIVEVIDHHKMKLETTSPPKITIRPYGSTATLIAQKIVRRGVKIDTTTAGLLLSAIIDDTLALRSPITTAIDKQMAGHLAVEAGVPNLSDFARELFNQKDVWLNMKASEVIAKDIKKYEMGSTNVGISQVETMDNHQLFSKISAYKKEMDKMRKENGLDLLLVMLTDLIRNDCMLIVSGEEKYITDMETVFSVKKSNDYEKTIHLPGVVSRKLQVEAPLIEYYGAL